MEREADDNISERMSDRTRVENAGVDQETIPTEDVASAGIGDAAPAIDDV